MIKLSFRFMLSVALIIVGADAFAQKTYRELNQI